MSKDFRFGLNLEKTKTKSVSFATLDGEIVRCGNREFYPTINKCRAVMISSRKQASHPDYYKDIDDCIQFLEKSGRLKFHTISLVDYLNNI